jgi:hypothetical protein
MRKHVKERRERLRVIAAADAQNRCAYCRVALTGTIYESLLAVGKFCSEACLLSADELVMHKRDEQS